MRNGHKTGRPPQCQRVSFRCHRRVAEHLGALTAEQDAALATTPADELLTLPMLQPDQVTDSLHAYQLAKRETPYG